MEAKTIPNIQNNYLYVFPRKFTQNPPLSDKKFCHPYIISKKTEIQKASTPVATMSVFECRHPKKAGIAEPESYVQVFPQTLKDCKLLNKFPNVSVFMFYIT